ncbi:MAG: alkene reductase [Nocardioidaceae bacterium]|nr:alkene reductase [Nocardioidaceae bacterium]
MTYQALWSPLTLGELAIENRVFMSPMTRNRGNRDGVPTELNAEYYAQRAGHGLIISEGTQPSEVGQGYMLTPGIHTEEQINGWKLTTDAVHAAGGRIFIQLMHVGRVSHPDNTRNGTAPVAPSPIAAPGEMFTPGGPQPMPVPRELSTEEVRAVVEEYADAAAAAIGAGADGIEIHGGYGYLPHQFLAPNTNQRTDEYGGSVENRVRFTVEVAAAIAERIGASRVGIRLSPGNPFNGIEEPQPRETYLELVRRLAEVGIAYVHYVALDNEELLVELREAWPSTLVLNRAGGDLASRAQDVADGLADAITVGTLALANPDLVTRMRTGAHLNEPDPATFYGGDHVGYTTYPSLG